MQKMKIEEEQLDELDYWTIIVLHLKLNYTPDHITTFLNISTSTYYNVLNQYNETKNPVRKSGKPKGYSTIDFPPLTNRKKKDHLSSIEKTAIITSAKLGHPRKEIMELVNVSKNIVTKVVKEFSESGNIRAKPISKPSRNQFLLNPKIVDTLCSYLEDLNINKQIATLKMAINFMIKNYDAHISKEAMRKLLHRLGFRPLLPKVVPLLTLEQRNQRKDYASKEINKS